MSSFSQMDVDAIVFEVKRQSGSVEEVGGLCRALDYARERFIGQSTYVQLEDLLVLVRLASCGKIKDFRKVPAIFNQGPSAIDAELIEDAISRLLQFQNAMDDDVFVHEFLKIHPFSDCNGRVGWVLHNWRKRLLFGELQTLPNFYFQ